MLVLRRTRSEAGVLGTINLTWRLVGRRFAPPPMYQGSHHSMKQLQKRGLHPQHPKNEEQNKKQRRCSSPATFIKNSWEIKRESGQ